MIFTLLCFKNMGTAHVYTYPIQRIQVRCSKVEITPYINIFLTHFSVHDMILLCYVSGEEKCLLISLSAGQKNCVAL